MTDFWTIFSAVSLGELSRTLFERYVLGTVNSRLDKIESIVKNTYNKINNNGGKK